MPRVVALDWHQIRTWNGAQDRAFEELCCQLARGDAAALPSGSRFIRRGTPDGGVECLWQLPDGTERGWQAKFFTESPGNTQWTEMDKSVRTALDRNSAMTHYTICLPCLLPDDRLSGRISAQQKWKVRVQKWTNWAKKLNRTVQFILWDESALLERLGRPENTGRRAFWFGGTAFTLAWFAEEGVRPAIRQAHARYTPPLHVEVPVQQTLAALTRDEKVQRRLISAGERVRRTMEENLRFILTDTPETSLLQQNAQEFSRCLAHWPSSVSENFDLAGTLKIVSEMISAARAADRAAWSSVPTPGRDRDFVLSQIRELTRALSELDRFLQSPEVTAAQFGRLIVSGEAGSGKTHLFCATAEDYIANGHPVILLLGEQFSAASEPWSQIHQLLGLQAARDEFLGALDAAGESAQCRAMILIDAVNEGPGVAYWKRHLGAMLEQFRSFPYVGLALSVRDAYVETIQEIVGSDAAWVEHHGFRGQVPEAARHFFRHYGLAEPNVPVLDPEYENPLFLKLLCETLRNHGDARLSDPPSFSDLLKMVLDNANARLAPVADYDPSERYVHRAVALIGQMMAAQQSDFLPWPSVLKELQALRPSKGFSDSLARHLLGEDLIVKAPIPGSVDGEECVRFAYQRFSDYLVVTEMLRREIQEGGTGAATLKQELADVDWQPAAKSWVEAVATIAPELGGAELLSMGAKYKNSAALRAAFLHSIVWRRRSAISSKTETHVRALLSRDDCRQEAFNTLLSIATRPDHPLNADWLDRFLHPLPMAERDAIWSTAIFGEWENDGNVRRLIEWGWQEDIANGLPKEVVRLAAITMAWMLTTSDRFVRDRATKALVSLLENRLDVLTMLVEHFADIQEPYLQERLHAVAYGCALRTDDTARLARLSQVIYDRIFRTGSPPPSVLLRDHARGTVETAIRRGAIIDHDPKLLVPPYRSEPPAEPPSEEELASTFHHNVFDKGHRSLSRIYESVTADDFNHYVIKDVMHWSGTPGGVPMRRSPRKLFRAILARMTPEDAEQMREIAKAYGKLDAHWLTEEQRGQLGEAFKQIEAEMPTELGRARARLFLSRIKPYLQNRHNPEFNSFFPLQLFERLILQRVLELGWRSELFEQFDASVPYVGREDHKAERIGKKYQWIAYDELHAQISDNYGLADVETMVMDEEDWKKGLWPTDKRDIDPTLLLRKTPREGWGVNHLNWWTPHRYSDWLSKPTPIQWLKSVDDVPPLQEFIRLRDHDGTSWLLLDGFHHWLRKVEAEGPWRPERDRQEFHLFFRAYLTKAEHLPALLKWGEKQNWINDRLPEPGHHFRTHLFEHYTSPRFDESLDDEWITGVWPENDLPHPLIATTAEYLCEHNTYDCSLDDTVKISIPSRWLATKLGLRIVGRSGDFASVDGKIVTFDPSTRERGQSVLVVREDALLNMLAREKMAIFWTLLGEKNYYPPEHSSEWPGRLTLLGVYSYKGQTISGSFRTEFHEGRE